MESAGKPGSTVSQLEQGMVQERVFHLYSLFAQVSRSAQTLMLELQRDEHLEYLTNGLRQLGPSFAVLDANRPWLCYWILHSIALLGDSVDCELEQNVVDFLNRCQDPNGGYGGGPGQMPHLATTYAAVSSLITVGGHDALSSINRGKLYSFLRRMKDASGGFRMHDNGEIDLRACYTAISVASILNILDEELIKDVGNYILSCQTYEGGMAGEPGAEAHGGYTYCGLATMILINEINRLDLASLIDWAVFRQGVECGFQGRTNKLVDGCYSFWQGAVLALAQRQNFDFGKYVVPDAGEDAGEDDCALESASGRESTNGSSSDDDGNLHIEPGVQESLSSSDRSSTSYALGDKQIVPLFHPIGLQQYLLLCSQVQDGGFRDKPGKARDYYHTCYCLSGLSLCHYSFSKYEYSPPLPGAVLGPYTNLVEPVHPLYNVILRQYHEARGFFQSDERSSS